LVSEIFDLKVADRQTDIQTDKQTDRQNSTSTDNKGRLKLSAREPIIMRSSLEDSPWLFSLFKINFTTKVQRQPREQGRRIKQG